MPPDATECHRMPPDAREAEADTPNGVDASVEARRQEKRGRLRGRPRRTLCRYLTKPNKCAILWLKNKNTEGDREGLERQGIRVKVSDISDALNIPRPGVTHTVQKLYTVMSERRISLEY